MKAMKFQPASDDLAVVLSRLSVACGEDSRRFERASREVSNEELALLFARYARRRGEFAKELSDQIDTLQGTDSAPISVTRLSGRKISSRLSGRRDDATILCDCEQAEKALCALYEEALGRDLPGDLQMSLRRQYMAVSDVHAQLHDLCEALAWCAVPMAV
jgi:uncharacterized protein (TIGR02284 family)